MRGRVVGWAAALALFAASCSAAVSDDPGSAGPTPAPTTDPPATTTTTAAPPATTTTAPPSPPPPLTPVYGGSLVYGIEADSLSPWTPQNTAMAASGHMVARAIYDPLALVTEDLEVVPNLLSTIEPNGDYTVWTLTVRPGIEFHDGVALDGFAVADNLQRHRRSLITGNILADVAEVTYEDMTVTVTMRRPWVSFPAALTGQAGLVGSPIWLGEVDENPLTALNPVGTGPFVFSEYVPGDRFVAVRNENYWREGLPYLDRVEFRVLRNIADRSAALVSGEVDIIHTANGDEITKFRDRLGAFNLVESAEFGETTFVLLNVGNPASPVADVRVRRALALALDYDLIRRARNGGIFPVPSGPFPPGTVGHLEDTGFPGYDPVGARQLVAAWEEENGPLAITFTTTSDEFNLLSAELYEQLWEEAGIEVTIEQIDQSQYIGNALVGNFEASFFRLYSGFDPDQQHHWWTSANARDPGTVGLNFGRMRDPVIDEQLDIIRTDDDPATRRVAAETINRRFGEELYSIWLGWAVWGIVSRPGVHQVNTGFTVPDGRPVLPTGIGIGGAHQLAQIWVEP